MSNSTCIVDGCENKPARYRDKCMPHRGEDLRAKFGPSPLTKAGSREGLIRRFWEKVVVQDGCWDWTGRNKDGYGMTSLKGATVYAHRLSYEIHHGEIPDGMIIDHICFTPQCSNPDHLRMVTYKQNTEHRQGPGKDNTSGRLGVSWRSDMSKWKATVKHNGVSYHCGFFSDREDAYAAVKAKRNELFTHNDMDRKAA